MSMFKGIADNSFADDVVSLEDLNAADDAIETSALEFLSIESDFNVMENLGDTIDNLYALHGAIEAYGIPQALVAFADRDLMLSTAIATFPSLERYNYDDHNLDEKKEGTKKGIVDTIKETVVRWASHAWQAVSKAAVAGFSHIAGWFTKFKKLAAEHAGKAFSAEKIKSAAAHAGAFTHEMFMKAIEWLKSSPAKVSALLKRKVPTDSAEHQAYVKEWASAAEMKEWLDHHGEGKATESLDEMVASLEKITAAAVHEARMIGKAAMGGLAKMGFTAENAKGVWNMVKSFSGSVLGGIGSVIKGLPGEFRLALSGLKTLSGEAHQWARKSIGAAMKGFWAWIKGVGRAIKGVFATGKSVAMAAE